MADALVTGSVVILFLAVGALVAYGLRTFRGGAAGTETEPGSRVRLSQEVLWTAGAAVLLLGIALAVH